MNTKEILKPGKPTEYLFCIILLIVIIYGLFNTSFSTIFTNNPENVVFKIGYPLIFFELTTDEPDKMPFQVGELIIDLVLYFIIAYGINLLLKFIAFILGRKSKNLSPEKLKLLPQAREAYIYYKEQGIPEEKIDLMFREKGWNDQDIEIIRH